MRAASIMHNMHVQQMLRKRGGEREREREGGGGHVLQYSRIIWRELNLADRLESARAKILVDLNLVVRYGIAIHIYHTCQPSRILQDSPANLATVPESRKHWQTSRIFRSYVHPLGVGVVCIYAVRAIICSMHTAACTLYHRCLYSHLCLYCRLGQILPIACAVYSCLEYVQAVL